MMLRSIAACHLLSVAAAAAAAVGAAPKAFPPAAAPAAWKPVSGSWLTPVLSLEPNSWEGMGVQEPQNGGQPLQSLHWQRHNASDFSGPHIATVDGVCTPRDPNTGLYNIWYHAGCCGGGLPTDVYHASSKDLIDWTVAPAGPVLSHQDEKAKFAYDQVADPSAVTAGCKAYAYDGDDNACARCTVHAGIGIGIAVADIPGCAQDANNSPSHKTDDGLAAQHAPPPPPPRKVTVTVDIAAPSTQSPLPLRTVDQSFFGLTADSSSFLDRELANPRWAALGSAPLRTMLAGLAPLAIDETVILLTLSLHHYIDTPTKGRGGGCSRMTVSSTARLR